MRTLAIALTCLLSISVYLNWLFIKDNDKTFSVISAVLRHLNISEETERSQRVDAIKGLPVDTSIEAFREDSLQQNEQHQIADFLTPPPINKQTLFLAFLNELQAKREFHLLLFHVRDYLNAYPDDSEGWMMEANALLHTEPLNIALLNYHNLLDKNINSVQRATIKDIIKTNLDRVINQLTHDNAWDVLAIFIEPLIQIDPLNRQLVLALATAYGMERKLALMEGVLAAVDYDDPLAQQLRGLVYSEHADTRSIANSSEESNDDRSQFAKRELSVTERNGQFFVQANVRTHTFTLLIDTGASTTAISQSTLDSIHHREKEFIGHFTVSTAGGAIQAPLYRLKRINISDTHVFDVTVLVLPNDNLPNFQGLLGMNVLRLLNFRFDEAQQRMILTER